MKLKLVALAAGLLASGAVLAQAKAPEPDYTLSFNVGAVTEYRYRGISQSRLKPALQGGADFSHKSGLYIGTWASTIRWIKDAGGDANAEVDVYGGYKFQAGPVGLDVGVLRYLYPGSSLPVNPDTTEVYLAGTWGPATLKYSHATTNLFGFADSEKSGYLDLSATFDTGYWGLSVTPHIGHQRVRNNSAFSYTDWSVTVAKEFMPGLTGTLAYVDTNTDTYRGPLPGNKDLGKPTVVLGVKYAF
ncbi:MAG TPA: TorF family putative porin [Ramlibacter sp.]|nr:TorF family putative porin [Ramlibacter sp.]